MEKAKLNKKSAIDYILYNQVGKERICKMKIDEKGEIDIKSDHNIITFQFEMDRRIYKK